MSLSFTDAARRVAPAGEAPGRVCPLRYRYGPGAIERITRGPAFSPDQALVPAPGSVAQRS